MGHISGKDIYRTLGTKIDSLTFRAPWNETFHALLRELYSPEEANLVVRMPATLTTFDNLKSATGYDEVPLRNLLDIPISFLPAGTYTTYLAVFPTGRLSSYYIWQTTFAP